MRGTIFRVKCVFLNVEILSGLTKSGEKQDKDAYTCQGLSDGMSGWWPHDQLSKMAKEKKL